MLAKYLEMTAHTHTGEGATMMTMTALASRAHNTLKMESQVFGSILRVSRGMAEKCLLRAERRIDAATERAV